MAISNLGDLKAHVADWTNREDIPELIPDFIRLAEDRINSDIRARLIKSTTTTVVPSEQQINPLTTDGEITDIYLEDVRIPFLTGPEYFTELRHRLRHNGGWTLLNGHAHISIFEPEGSTPPPSGGAPITVTVTGFPTSDIDYSDNSSTSEALLRHPSLFVFGSIMEAATYLRDSEAMLTYANRYEDAVERLKQSYRRAAVAGGLAVGLPKHQAIDEYKW